MSRKFDLSCVRRGWPENEPVQVAHVYALFQVPKRLDEHGYEQL